MSRLIKFLLSYIPRPWLIRISLVFMKFTAFLYRGNNVECPVCGGRFKKFMPYGYTKSRKNVLCPKCLSLERHRLVWLFLKNRTRFFTDELRVLHVAPEQCFYKRFRSQKNLRYVTADLESPIADVKLDIQEMPFQDNEFDMVICNHVLEHVPDDRKAMREIFRVLRHGGFAILLVPFASSMDKTYEDPSITDPRDREKHFRQKDHYRIYGKDYLQRIKDEGFTIPDENYLNTLSEEEKEKFRLPKSEFMYGYYKM